MSWSVLKSLERGRTRGNDPPATYEVRCRCSKINTGVRIPLVQRLRCEGCGHPLFILPISVYPLPAEAPPRKGKGKKKKSKKGKASTQRVAGVGRTIALRFLSICAFPILWLWARFLAGMQRILIWMAKPLHAVAIGLIVIVAATGSWSVLRWRQESAKETLAKVPPQAEQLLHDRKIPDAAQELQKLDRAVRILGRNDPHSLMWKQWSAEAHAAVNLMQGSILDLVTEAEEYRQFPTAKWERTFNANYRKSWLILDSTALKAGESAPKRVELQMRVRGKLVILSADLGRQPWHQALQGSKRVICAGRLEKCRQESDSVWRIELDPASVTLLTNPDIYAFATLATLDGQKDEDLEKQLQRQAEILGVKEP